MVKGRPIFIQWLVYAVTYSSGRNGVINVNDVVNIIFHGNCQ